jgi:hypothetical protein
MTTYQKLKSKLTRAQNSKDPYKVLAEVRKFSSYYNSISEPLPDDWSRWQRAADDAVYELQRKGVKIERETL